MPRTTLVPLLLLASLLVAGAALAQGDMKPAPNRPAPPPTSSSSSHSTGGRERVTSRVAVGEQAPDFELDQIDGSALRLSTLHGSWVMLFFLQRRDSLSTVEPVARALKSKGVRTLAVCFDKPQALAHHLAGREVPYTPLADPTGDIMALYGLFNNDAPQPGFVLINPLGEVRMALLGQGLPGRDASRLVEYAVTGED